MLYCNGPSSLIAYKTRLFNRSTCFQYIPRTYTSSLSKSKTRHIFLLHGLLGNKFNWNSISQNLSLLLNKDDCLWNIHCIDLLNHGRNIQGQSSPNALLTYPIIAQDVYKTIKESLSKFSDNDNTIYLLGHSLGGKVAMHLALDPPADLSIEKLVCVDISPKSYLVQPLETATIYQYIQWMKNLEKQGFTDRKSAETFLAQYEPSLSLRNFILTNLVLRDNRLVFRNDLSLFERSLSRLMDFPIGPSVARPCVIPTLFIRGTKSDYISSQDEDLIRSLFPNSKIEEIEAGHWVHIDNQQEFIKALLSFLCHS